MVNELNIEHCKNEMKHYKQYNKKYHDSHCRSDVRYAEGDLVRLRTTKSRGQSIKLNAKFRGPYQVMKVLNWNRYVIEDIPGFQISNTHFSGV